MRVLPPPCCRGERRGAADSQARHFGVAAAASGASADAGVCAPAADAALRWTRHESRPLAARTDMLGLGTIGILPRETAGLPPTLLLLPLLLGLQRWPVVRADIRCHCNLAPCVSTGYMCKSELGMCFSESVQMTSSLNAAATTAPRHGCVDLLPDVTGDTDYGCKEHDDGPPAPQQPPPESPSAGWRCCSDDMCNFQRDFALPGASEPRTRNGDQPGTPSFTHLVWFRAAVIAVPIAGGSVLVLLVLLAARLLRKDSELPSTAASFHAAHEALHKGRHRSLLRDCLRGCFSGTSPAMDKGVVLV